MTTKIKCENCGNDTYTLEMTIEKPYVTERTICANCGEVAIETSLDLED